MALVQPAGLLKLAAGTSPGSALEVDPESLPSIDLKINVPPAHLRVIENHVGPRITTDQGERLMQ